MRGKEKCKALKEIRRQIAEKNDIAYAVSECTYQGECKGTCPKCEAELRYLERELAIRQGLGKAAVIAGISVGVCAPMIACSPVDIINDVIYEITNFGATEGVAEPPTNIQPSQQLTGDVQIVEPSEEDIMGMEGPNPDLVESSEEDSTLIHYPNSEYNPEELEAGEVLPEEYYDPSLEYNGSEELAGQIPVEESSEEIELEVLEGDIAIDPEALNEN